MRTLRRAFALALLSATPAAAFVISGYSRFGEGWNEPLSEDDNDRDSEDIAEYDFTHFHLGVERKLSERVRLNLDLDNRERKYEIASSLDNDSRRMGLRLQFDPTDRLTLWLRGSMSRKNYDRSNLDNEPMDASTEARWRWGVRNNFRLGVSYSDAEYRADPGRDRARRRLFAGWERPVNDRLTLEVNGDVEDRSFRVPSAARQNSSARSASVGFRWDLTGE